MKSERLFKRLFFLQAGVNLVGALGPELGFDALWYHLPEARMIAERGWWGIIPGGLLYTTGLPRGMEIINAGLLKIGYLAKMSSPEILPKLLSWLSGVLSAGLIVKLGTKLKSEKVGWVAAASWYTALVVGWQSITTYVDLQRTLLTLIAVWLLLEGRWKWSAMAMGIAYSVKNFAGIDAVAMAIVWAYGQRDWKMGVKYLLWFAPLPILWAGANYLQGYPFFYPVGGYYGLKEHWGGGIRYWLGPIHEMLAPSVRVGPAILVILILGWRKVKPLITSQVGLLTSALLVAWYVTPRSWDGRYFLPVLALLSVLAVWGWSKTGGIKYKLGLGILLLQAIFGVGYRTAANARFVPVIMKSESKEDFLSRRLDLAGADWVDEDNWVTQNWQKERYLVIGVHNTYYLPGDRWEHESWRSKDYCYKYVLIKGGGGVKDTFELLHETRNTDTKVYRDISCD